MLVRFTGTHTGEHSGLAPTGRPIDIEMVAILDFDEAGKVAAERVIMDSATVLGQLA